MALPDDGTSSHPPNRERAAAAPVVAEPLVVAIAANGSPERAVRRDVAHRPPGVLHRAVSIQVVDPDGNWLLQRRAASKPLFGNRWSNTCCTHPMPGEDLLEAAARRVREELGLVLSDGISAGVFTYRATDPQTGLVEHELDHVFVALIDTGTAVANPREVIELAKLPFSAALTLVGSESGTPWAPEVLQLAFAALHDRNGER